MKEVGCRHSSVDSPAPSIRHPGFESHAHHLSINQFIELYNVKNTKINKIGWDWPIFKHNERVRERKTRRTKNHFVCLLKLNLFSFSTNAFRISKRFRQHLAFRKRIIARLGTDGLDQIFILMIKDSHIIHFVTTGQCRSSSGATTLGQKTN